MKEISVDNTNYMSEEIDNKHNSFNAVKNFFKDNMGLEKRIVKTVVYFENKKCNIDTVKKYLI